MKEKLTVKDIKKAVKILEKHKLKPDDDGLITIEQKRSNKIFDKFISRFAEAVHYKITRDILLYGTCVLEIGSIDDLNEIVAIRKMLDEDIENWENMMRQIKATKVGNSDIVTDIRK